MAPFMILAAVTVGLCIVVEVLAGLRSRARRGARGPRPSLPVSVALFLLFASLSLFWSANYALTMRALAFYIGVAALAVLASGFVSPKVFVRGLAIGLVLIAATSVASVPLDRWPTHARAGFDGNMIVFQGLYRHWNILAYTLFLLLPALVTPLARRTGWRILQLIAVIAVAFVFVPVKSATGMITGAVVLGAAAAVLVIRRVARRRTEHPSRRRRRRESTGHGRRVVPVATAVIVLGAIALVATRIPALLHKDVATLSGRVPLWRAIAQVGDERAWEGYGLGAVWSYHWLQAPRTATLDAINARIPYPLGHGHNGLLDTALQVGAIGSVLYLGIMARAVWLASRNLTDPSKVGSMWVLVSACAIAVGSITEPIWLTPLGWFVVVAMACVAERERRPARHRPRPRHATA